MGDPIQPYLNSNAAWAQTFSQTEPELQAALAKGQSPKVLWLGCSDSRVPETTILGLKPGDVFVHRNIANIITPTDLSALSVIEYSVVYLKVEQIIVCGHTSCGGVAASLGGDRLGKIDTWLMPLRKLRLDNAAAWDKLSDADKSKALVEANVQASVETVRQNPDVIKAAKERGLAVHGVVYDLASGKLLRLDTNETDADKSARAAAFGV